MDFKRQTFLEKNIEDIRPESDIAISILGRVIDISGRNIVIDDGTGNANAYFVNDESSHGINSNDLVKLFGFVMPNPTGFEIKGDFVQKMNGLDVALYKKTVLKKTN